MSSIESNLLRLNSTKTQFIWLGTRQQLTRLDMAVLSVAFHLLTFSSAKGDLEVTLDSELIFFTHINLLSRDCFYQLRQLRTIAPSLTVFATSTLTCIQCTCLRYTQTSLLLRALRWTPSLSAGVPCRVF